MRSRKRAFPLGLGERGDDDRRAWRSRRCVPAFTASTASAVARWLLPVPGGPSRCTTSARSMNFSSASARMRLLSSEGWKAKSKPASVLMVVRRASMSAVLMRRFSRMRELLDQQLVDGLDARRSRPARCGARWVEHLEGARHPQAPPGFA